MWEPGGKSGRDAAKTHFAQICECWPGHTTTPRPTPQLQQLPCIVGQNWQPTKEPDSHILSSVESLKPGKVFRFQDLALIFFNNVSSAQGRSSGKTRQGDNHQYGCVAHCVV